MGAHEKTLLRETKKIKKNRQNSTEQPGRASLNPRRLLSQKASQAVRARISAHGRASLLESSCDRLHTEGTLWVDVHRQST